MPSPTPIIVISCTEDGDHRLYRYQREEFLRLLHSDFWGPDVNFASPDNVPYLDHFVGIIVIAGDIVVPKVKKVVKRYDL